MNVIHTKTDDNMVTINLEHVSWYELDTHDTKRPLLKVGLLGTQVLRFGGERAMDLHLRLLALSPLGERL